MNFDLNKNEKATTRKSAQETLPKAYFRGSEINTAAKRYIKTVGAFIKSLILWCFSFKNINMFRLFYQRWVDQTNLKIHFN